MSISQLLLIFLTVIAISAGQILFKLTANEMHLHLSFSSFLTNILNIKLLIALIVYAIATVLWLIVLKLTPLRIAYPFMGLSFICVSILASIFLGETIHWQTFAGALLIFCGIWLASSS